jgi:hypothetical protein
METAVVLLSSATAVAALILALLIGGRLVRSRRRPLLPAGALSNRGLAWLGIGLAATALFIYLDISLLIPLPVVLVGIAYLIKDSRRQPPSAP